LPPVAPERPDLAGKNKLRGGRSRPPTLARRRRNQPPELACKRREAWPWVTDVEHDDEDALLVSVRTPVLDIGDGRARFSGDKARFDAAAGMGGAVLRRRRRPSWLRACGGATDG
jgi:hypothetical protein